MNDLKWLLESGWTVFSSDYEYQVYNLDKPKPRYRAVFRVRLRREIDVITDIVSWDIVEIEGIFNLLGMEKKYE